MSILKSTDEIKPTTASQIHNEIQEALSRIRGVDFETFDFGDFLPLRDVLLQRKIIAESGFIFTKEGTEMMDYLNALICRYLGIY